MSALVAFGVILVTTGHMQAQTIGRAVRDSLLQAGRQDTTQVIVRTVRDFDDDDLADTLTTLRTTDLRTGRVSREVPHLLCWGMPAPDTTMADTAKADTTHFDITFTGDRRVGMYFYDDDGDGVRDIVLTVLRSEQIMQPRRDDRGKGRGDSVRRIRTDRKRWAIHTGTALRDRDTCRFRGAEPGAEQAAWITAAVHVDTARVQYAAGGGHAIRRIAPGGGEAFGRKVVHEDPVLPSDDDGVLFSIVPNPARDVARLQVRGTAVPTDARMLVRDASGRVVLTLPWTTARESISLRHLSAGTYTVEVTADDRILGRTTMVIIR